MQTQVPIQARPKQVQLNDVKIWVVSKENYDEFVKEYAKKNGSDSYIAISIKDYENLSLNFAELRRYIEQQKQIIIYYEEAIKPKQPSVEVSEEVKKEKSKFLQKIYDKVKPNKKEEVTDGTVQ